MDIKVIAFDLGDVLVRDDTKRLEKKYNFDGLSKTQQKRYINAFHSAEIGKLSTLDLFRTVQDTLTPNLSIKAIREEVIGVPLIKANWQLALRLKKHYRVVILSNSEKNWPHAIARRLKINIKQFPIFNSAYIGIRKPHENFFLYALRELKIKPEQMVFVDDRPANVASAKKLGIHAFLYHHNHSELLKFLRRLKIKGL